MAWPMNRKTELFESEDIVDYLDSGDFVILEGLIDIAADDLLLLADALGGVDFGEAVFVGDSAVLVEDAALEEPEAADEIGSEAEVHAGFVILELRAAGNEAGEADIDGEVKIKPAGGRG